MATPQIIIDLVERFERNIEEYKRAHNETQIRREFIDPFFTALGWDVDNKGGAAPQYQDVIHEAQQIVGGSMKAPDYAFRVGGTKKFYVEAKKPSVWVKEAPAPAYQVRSYGWSAKLPVSIVTDFEELAVYDCTQKPKNGDKPSVARINYFTYKDYLTRWDEIESVFSKEAVLKGQFDKYGETSKGKRGTTTVDKAFLLEIESWRELLAKNFAKNNKISEDELKFATQRTLDRIIFLRICEARGIEEEGRLQEAVTKPNSFKELFTLFQAADNRYNSGLFYFRKGDKVHKTDSELDTITPKLKLDDKILKEIIAGLYYPSPYKFDVIPADILGQVYEQFLGKVIRMTSGGMVKIEEKPEVRKAGGVYYTPTYIVDYIVKNTVGEILNGQKQTNIKILDPACGSGSFLLGAYDYILKWYLEQYTKEAKTQLAKKNSPIYEVSTKNYALTTSEKKRILLEHIYGVDIDENAVEVAKLNLMLKCLEGEGAATLKLSVERILPDLSDNIKCGNSLIGSDFNDGLFSTDEHKKINPFDWNTEFADVMKKGGFDAIIGNPPYIRMEAFKEVKDYFRAQYFAHEERSDIYTYFLEKGSKLLNKDAKLGMIVSNKFLRANYGRNLREFLSKNVAVEKVIDFAGLPVFIGATVRTIVVVLNSMQGKQKINNILYSPPFSIQKFEDVSKGRISVELAISNNSWSVASSSLNSNSWNFQSKDSELLNEKMAQKCQSLQRYVNGKILMGIKSGLTNAFIIDRVTRDRLVKANKTNEDIIKPLLNGRDIRRYYVDSSDLFIIYTYKGVDIKKYPEIESHLRQFKSKLEARATKQNWYELQQAQYAFKDYLDGIKIVFPDIATEPRFVIDENGYYVTNTVYFIPTTDKYLLGLLNSKVGFYYFKQVCAGLEGKNEIYLRFFGQYLEGFPVRILDKTELKTKDNIISLVDRMLTLNKELPLVNTPNDKTRIERQIAATDNEIDKLVYELYGLTEEEIKIVEGA